LPPEPSRRILDIVKVHLVDGTYELFRAFYGGQSAKTAGGVEVGAARTLARSLLSLLREDGVTHVAIAYDHVIESFRNQLFDGYKTGDGIDAALFGQFGLAERVSAGLGILTWAMIDFEADDAMATAARLAEDDLRVTQVQLMSPDKDLCQCVNGTRVIAVDRMRKKQLDQDGVMVKFGVPPRLIPDYLALVGDTADGIPGIPGWGATSAAAALVAHGDLEAIPTDPALLGGKIRGAARLVTNLNERRQDALLYRTLATLRRDVPLGVSVDDLEYRGPDPALFAALVAELDDTSLSERVEATLAHRRGVTTTP
jgi:5'-3' exonuclease